MRCQVAPVRIRQEIFSREELFVDAALAIAKYSSGLFLGNTGNKGETLKETRFSVSQTAVEMPESRPSGIGSCQPGDSHARLKTKTRDESYLLKKLWEQVMRQVIIYPGEDQHWVAECPSLPGCVSQGRTREEAISNIREAIQEYISALEEDQLPVPPDRFEAMLVAV